MNTRQYLFGLLERQDLNEDPIKQLELWLQEALRLEPEMPEAMTLATVDQAGMPDARVVLIKELKPAGLVFFTNYNSVKAQQLRKNPQAASVFWWPYLERQVRIRGQVSKLSEKESDIYFAKRPRGSQLGAWCSNQSAVLHAREELEEAYAKLEKNYEGKEIPRPKHWGGYCLKPSYFEFWQGRDNRLHDRFAYELNAQGIWTINRLAP